MSSSSRYLLSPFEISMASILTVGRSLKRRASTSPEPLPIDMVNAGCPGRKCAILATSFLDKEGQQSGWRVGVSENSGKGHYLDSSHGILLALSSVLSGRDALIGLAPITENRTILNTPTVKDLYSLKQLRQRGRRELTQTNSNLPASSSEHPRMSTFEPVVRTPYS